MTCIMEKFNDHYQGSSEAPADDVRLSKLECHFKWLKDKTCVKDYLVNKILEDIEDNPKVLLRGRLYLFYLYATGGYELEKVTKVQNLIQENIEERNFEASNPEYVQGLQYIMKANQAHLLMSQHRSKEAENLAESLTSFDSLTNRSKAIIFACKTYALSNCTYYDARLEAVESAKDTLRLDDENPEWHFSLGLSLGRKRRHDLELRDKDIATIDRKTQEEEEALLRAEKGGHESAKIFRADLYREKAFAVITSSEIKEDTKKKKYADTMNTKSLEILENIYSELSKGEHKNLSVIKRLAFCFNKLPKSFKRLDYAEKCFLLALEKSPDCARAHEEYGHFLQCIHYNDPQSEIKALEHLKLSWINTLTNISGFIKYARLKKRLQKDYDPCNDFYKVFHSKGLTDERKAYLLCFYGDYLQSMEKTLDAIENWKEALRFDPHGRNTKYVLSKLTFTSNSQKKTTDFQKKLLEALEKEVENAADCLDKAKKKMDVAWFHRTKKPSDLHEELKLLNEAVSLIDGLSNTDEKIQVETELCFKHGEALYRDHQFDEAHWKFSQVTSSYKNKEKVDEYLSSCNYEIAKQRISAATSCRDKKDVLPILKESSQNGCLDACLLFLQIIQDEYDSKRKEAQLFTGGRELYEGIAITLTVDEGFSLNEQKEVLKQTIHRKMNYVLTIGLSSGRDTVGLRTMREKRIEMSKQLLTLRDKKAQSKLIIELLAEANFCLDRVCRKFGEKYYPHLYTNTKKTPMYPRIRDKDQIFTDKELLKDYVKNLLKNTNWSKCGGLPFEDKFPDLFNVIIESMWKKDSGNKHLHKVWFQQVNDYKHGSAASCEEDLNYYYNLAHEAADITEEVVEIFFKAMEV